MGRPRKTVDARSRFGNVEEHRPGRHTARYRLNGASRSKTFDTAEEAWNWLATISADRYRKVSKHDPNHHRLTVDDVAQGWVNSHMGPRDATMDEYEKLYERAIKPTLGDDRIGDVDFEDIAAWAKKRLKTRAANTVRNERNVLSMIVDHAVAMGYRVANPTKRLVIPNNGPVEEMVFLTHPEVLRLVAAMREQFRLPVKLGAYSGLRAGEIWALRSNWFDPDTGLLRIMESVRYVPRKGLVRTLPKNGRPDVIRLPRLLIPEMIKQIEGKGPNDLIFTSLQGSPVRHNNFYERYFRPAVAASGIEKRPRFHDLRHTCAAFHFSTGATGEEVRQALRHSSIQTTHTYYAHTFPEAFQRMADNISDSIEAALLSAQTGAEAHTEPTALKVVS